MKLSEAVRGVSGTLAADGEFSCIAFATEQEQSQFLTFLEKEKFLPALDNSKISCVLTTSALAEKIPPHIKGVFLCDRPKAALFEIHNRLARHPDYVGASAATVVGEGCSISPLAAIDRENVVIGDRVTIEPFVVIKGRVIIGNDVTIRSGAVIGCKGFSFSKDTQGQNVSVEDTARIIIEDHVEIFEQVAISTGIFPWEETRIGENTVFHCARLPYRSELPAGEWQPLLREQPGGRSRLGRRRGDCVQPRARGRRRPGIPRVCRDERSSRRADSLRQLCN